MSTQVPWLLLGRKTVTHSGPLLPWPDSQMFTVLPSRVGEDQPVTYPSESTRRYPRVDCCVKTKVKSVVRATNAHPTLCIGDYSESSLPWVTRLFLVSCVPFEWRINRWTRVTDSIYYRLILLNDLRPRRCLLVTVSFLVRFLHSELKIIRRRLGQRKRTPSRWSNHTHLQLSLKTSPRY